MRLFFLWKLSRKTITISLQQQWTALWFVFNNRMGEPKVWIMLYGMHEKVRFANKYWDCLWISIKCTTHAIFSVLGFRGKWEQKKGRFIANNEPNKNKYDEKKSVKNGENMVKIIENWIFSNENQKRENQRLHNAQNWFKNIDVKGSTKRHTFHSNLLKWNACRYHCIGITIQLLFWMPLSFCSLLCLFFYIH